MKQNQAPTRLRNLRVREISAVDRPANLGAEILITKDQGEPRLREALRARNAELRRRMGLAPPAREACGAGEAADLRSRPEQPGRLGLRERLRQRNQQLRKRLAP